MSPFWHPLNILQRPLPEQKPVPSILWALFSVFAVFMVAGQTALKKIHRKMKKHRRKVDYQNP